MPYKRELGCDEPVLLSLQCLRVLKCSQVLNCNSCQPALFYRNNSKVVCRIFILRGKELTVSANDNETILVFAKNYPDIPISGALCSLILVRYISQNITCRLQVLNNLILIDSVLVNISNSLWSHGLTNYLRILNLKKKPGKFIVGYGSLSVFTSFLVTLSTLITLRFIQVS